MGRREKIIGFARAWVGTPYRHGASRRGVGADCLGLLRGVYRELHGSAPLPPPYTPDWGETPDENGNFEEPLLAAASHYFNGIDVEDIQGGDVILFRLFARGPIKHCAILTSPATMIHAYSGHEVSEVPLASWWKRHITHAFAFDTAADIEAGTTTEKKRL